MKLSILALAVVLGAVAASDTTFKELWKNDQFQEFYNNNMKFQSFVNDNYSNVNIIDSEFKNLVKEVHLRNNPDFSHFYKTNTDFKERVYKIMKDVKANELKLKFQELVKEFKFEETVSAAPTAAHPVPEDIGYLAVYSQFMTLWKEHSFRDAYGDDQIFRDAVQSRAFRDIVPTIGFKHLVNFPSVLQYILSEQFAGHMEELSKESPQSQESLQKIIESFNSRAFYQIVQTEGFKQLVKFPATMKYLLSEEFADDMEELSKETQSSQESLQKIIESFNSSAFDQIVRTDGFKQLMEFPAFIKLFKYQHFRDFILSGQFRDILNNPDVVQHFKNYISSDQFVKDRQDNENLFEAFGNYMQKQYQKKH